MSYCVWIGQRACSREGIHPTHTVVESYLRSTRPLTRYRVDKGRTRDNKPGLPLGTHRTFTSV
eukprot:6211812-Pleurochrysis_carterae.AAC.3